MKKVILRVYNKSMRTQVDDTQEYLPEQCKLMPGESYSNYQYCYIWH